MGSDSSTLILRSNGATPTNDPYAASDQSPFAVRRRVRHEARRVGTGRDVQPIDIDTSHLAWQADAVCVGSDPEMFFPEGPVSRYLVALCAGCPAYEACLGYAIDNPMLHGIWAGTTAQDRQRIRRRQRERQAG